MEPPSPELIRSVARELQGIDLPPDRAAVLAVEVGELDAGVLRLGPALAFADEPTDFARILDEAGR